MSKLHDFGVGLWRSLKIMARNKVGFAGFLITVLIVLTVYIAPHFVPPDVTAHLDQIYTGPTHVHPLGTDYQGRDILNQILNGGRDVVYVAALAGFLTVALGVVLGALSALVGGWVDAVIGSVAELVLTIPHFPLLMVLAGFIRLTNSTALAFILCSLSWGALMRTIRAQVLTLRERDYVQAARSLGLPTSHLLFKEILPNMMSYILINFVMSMTGAIYASVGLIFLGIVPLATNNWGVMLNLAWAQGAIFSANARWYLLVPVAVIVLLQFSLVSMNRSLDELFNPRLRVGE